MKLISGGFKVSKMKWYHILHCESMEFSVMMAMDLDSFARRVDKFVVGRSWLLVMTAVCYLHMQQPDAFEYQLQRSNNGREICCFSPTCGLSRGIWWATAGNV